MEPEVTPQLPTSGQILGFFAKSLGISDPRIQSRTARRYFSGHLKNQVKESSRAEIIGAIADALVNVGLAATPPVGDEGLSASPALATIIDQHAVNWDRLRAFLRPRMMRVLPHHLPAVWQAYVRLAVIDLALRVAAHIHLVGASLTVLDLLNWINVNRRGAYLNSKRSKVGISLNSFVEAVEVNDKTVEAWLYHGARPSDENLARIATALASKSEPSERNRLVRDLRALYWISDVAEILEQFIGTEAVGEIVGQLRRYASLVYRFIDEETFTEPRPTVFANLVKLGAHSRFAGLLLTALINSEPNDVWKEDLLAAGSDWVHRVLGVNLQIDQAEVDALIRETDGRVLKDWDISNPKAHAHYRRSMELQIQGRIDEALAEVAKAAELDPLDPANHFTLGSVKGTVGARNGDEALVAEGLEACWLAATLDPKWIVPWTEIGWLLLESGREREAVRHLRSVRPECGPLDSNYYNALGMALWELGEFTECLPALESSLELNADNPHIVVAAAVAAWQTGDSVKFNRYRKIARHVGASNKCNRLLELVKCN
ncbi:MAG: hypothetical protein OXQ27_05870 [Chloroflexota bacterium]|nr:hypothetical protein [Chloroflexota bacterium]